MTFYHQQILKLTAELYPSEHLCRQIMLGKRFIDGHYSKVVRLDQVAREAFLSKFHFIRLFKVHYGRTPHQYLTGVRIARAKELLRSGMTVSGVCLAIGFDSVTSFTGLFKKITGYTPLAFQRRKNF